MLLTVLIEITWKCEDLVEKALNEAMEAEEVMVEVEAERKAG